MSDALYAVRLTWQGWRGHLAFGGVHIDLMQAPQILARLGFVSVEYTPALRVSVCQPIAYGERDMTLEEVRAVRGWLEETSAAVRAAVETTR